MKIDNNIIGNCPLCGQHSLHCSSEVDDELQQCISCGYVTSANYKGTRKDNKLFQQLSPDMQKWAVEANGKIWIPSMVTLPIGLIYPEDNETTKMENDIQWSFAPMITIPEEEREHFPNPAGGVYEKRIDIENKQVWSTFLEAMVFVNDIIKEEKEKTTLPKLKKKTDAKTKTKNT